MNAAQELAQALKPLGYHLDNHGLIVDAGPWPPDLSPSRQSAITAAIQEHNAFMAALVVVRAQWTMLNVQVTPASLLGGPWLETLRAQARTLSDALSELADQVMARAGALTLSTPEIERRDAEMETIREQRQALSSGFENTDQKCNQLFAILAAVMDNIKDMQYRVIRNMV